MVLAARVLVTLRKGRNLLFTLRPRRKSLKRMESDHMFQVSRRSLSRENAIIAKGLDM